MNKKAMATRLVRMAEEIYPKIIDELYFDEGVPKKPTPYSHASYSTIMSHGDDVRQFLYEYIEESGAPMAHITPLYNAFIEWAKINNVEEITIAKFSSVVSALGHARGRDRVGRYVVFKKE